MGSRTSAAVLIGAVSTTLRAAGSSDTASPICGSRSDAWLGVANSASTQQSLGSAPPGGAGSSLVAELIQSPAASARSPGHLRDSQGFDRGFLPRVIAHLAIAGPRRARRRGRCTQTITGGTGRRRSARSYPPPRRSAGPCPGLRRRLRALPSGCGSLRRD